MVAFLGGTVALAQWTTLSGLPALPAISLGFLLPNVDLLWVQGAALAAPDLTARAVAVLLHPGRDVRRGGGELGLVDLGRELLKLRERRRIGCAAQLYALERVGDLRHVLREDLEVRSDVRRRLVGEFLQELGLLLQVRAFAAPVKADENFWPRSARPLQFLAEATVDVGVVVGFDVVFGVVAWVVTGSVVVASTVENPAARVVVDADSLLPPQPATAKPIAASGIRRSRDLRTTATLAGGHGRHDLGADQLHHLEVLWSRCWR